MRIFLIGFMGSGKSTTGRELASILGLRFIDLDACLEERCGRTISGIFAAEGEARFRELEYNCLKSLLEKDDFVLATGGGTPCFYDSMDLMNGHGITVYLKMSAEGLFGRLGTQAQTRPLLEGKKGRELADFIHSSLEKREPFYLKAQYKVKAKDLKPDELAGFLRNEALK